MLFWDLLEIDDHNIMLSYIPLSPLEYTYLYVKRHHDITAPSHIRRLGLPALREAQQLFVAPVVSHPGEGPSVSMPPSPSLCIAGSLDFCSEFREDA